MTRLDLRAKQAHGFIREERFTDAWPIISDLLNENPDNPEALYLGGCVLRGQHHVGMALALFRRALAGEQKQPNLWMHYGACLHDTHDYEGARQAFAVVHKALPNDPMPTGNIAASYVQEGRLREAIEWADKALGADPANVPANIAKGYACLGLGRWAEGWKHIEALYGESLRIRVYNPPEREEPLWDGSKGKTVVVQADQGLGDQIMFAQCLPDMVRDCKQVIVETNPRLENLFRRSFPGLTVYGSLKKASDVKWPLQYQIDAHIHLSLLGRFYRTRNEDFPRAPYLVPCETLRAKWRAWLEQFPRPWVGIAWRGGIATTNVVARSINLAEYRPIMEHGGTFISMAYQDVAAEVAHWNKHGCNPVQVPQIDNDGDFDETVALAAELDHVITVQTTLAHVRGALGKPAYVLVNRIAQWRYAATVDEGRGMIWYPQNSVCLYRQKPGEPDWAHAIKRVADDYAAFVLPRSKAA